ncbi:hypothetical protein [Flexithrix dorotheae]|uniref:hypothetical protein n=1 Tax=Flexithrix dorotheae TaxID=70993 RepID=UPI0003792F7D|nr:hypothetical protein [Flexithrix dorotheae]
MNFEIIPFKSVGSLEFNLTKEQVRQVLNTQYETTIEALEPIIERDTFDELGLFVYYDEKGLLKTILIFNEKENKLLFQGKDLMSMTFVEIITFFKDLDENFHLDEDKVNLISPKYGLQFYFFDINEFFFEKGNLRELYKCSFNINVFRDKEDLLFDKSSF